MDNLGECVVLADIEVSSAKTWGVWLYKKKEEFGISKPAIIKKNEVISINQLNYKVSEKSHATEELVSCIPWQEMVMKY